MPNCDCCSGDEVALRDRTEHLAGALATCMMINEAALDICQLSGMVAATMAMVSVGDRVGMDDDSVFAAMEEAVVIVRRALAERRAELALAATATHNAPDSVN